MLLQEPHDQGKKLLTNRRETIGKINIPQAGKLYKNSQDSKIDFKVELHRCESKYS
jgi:hypothetical protein